MAPTRRDDLAKRLADRLDKAPPKGRAMSAPAEPTTQGSPKQPRPKAAARPAPVGGAPSGTKRATPRPRPARRPDISADSVAASSQRPRRGSIGTVLRGHLVPDSVHVDARRRKARLRAARGVRVTWDDVMTEGLDLLAERRERTESTLGDVRSMNASSGRRRLVQATLPVELDQRLVEIQLDLSERDDSLVTYEQLWATAILLWLSSTAQDAR